MNHWPLFLAGLWLGFISFPVALMLLRDAREFRRRVTPPNEQAREEGRLRELVLSGAVVTPMPGRGRLRMKGEAR